MFIFTYNLQLFFIQIKVSLLNLLWQLKTVTHEVWSLLGSTIMSRFKGKVAYYIPREKWYRPGKVNSEKENFCLSCDQLDQKLRRKGAAILLNSRKKFLWTWFINERKKIALHILPFLTKNKPIYNYFNSFVRVHKRGFNAVW